MYNQHIDIYQRSIYKQWEIANQKRINRLDSSFRYMTCQLRVGMVLQLYIDIFSKRIDWVKEQLRSKSSIKFVKTENIMNYLGKLTG